MIFIYLTYTSNPYLFDALTRPGDWFGYTDEYKERYAAVRIGMTAREVHDITGIWPAGKREYSKDGKLCRETYWDEGSGRARKLAPVCYRESECETHMTQWSLADPPPNGKEYVGYKIEFINGRVVKKSRNIERLK